MATITTLNASDDGATSRGVINTNFSNLNVTEPVINYSDYNDVNDAIDAAALVKANVQFPYNTEIEIATTVLLKDNVKLLLNGCTLKWTGAADGNMISNSTAGGPLYYSGVENGFLDTNTSNVAGIGLYLHSPVNCTFKDLVYKNGDATFTVIYIKCDVTDLNWESNCNAVGNYFENISGEYAAAAAICGYGMILEGTETPTGIITLNEFKNFHFPSVKICGYSFTQWVDNNVLSGVHRVNLSANSSYGMIFNNSATPTANVGVYNNYVEFFAPDIFGEYTGRIGVAMQKCKQTVIDNLFWSSTTGWTTSTIINNVSDLAESYQIRVTGYGDDSRIGTAQKNFMFDGNLGIGHTVFADGDKVIGMVNTTTPSGTPTGGGVIFVEAGALKYKGAAGSVTVLGAA